MAPDPQRLWTSALYAVPGHCNFDLCSGLPFSRCCSDRACLLNELGLVAVQRSPWILSSRGSCLPAVVNCMQWLQSREGKNALSFTLDMHAYAKSTLTTPIRQTDKQTDWWTHKDRNTDVWKDERKKGNYRLQANRHVRGPGHKRGRTISSTEDDAEHNVRNQKR